MAETDKLIHEDLERVRKLSEDLAFYRTATDDGGLGRAAWIELFILVSNLPEAEK
jgi:hypothetical protein